MRMARMARNEGRGLTTADKQTDEKAHAHGNQHGLGGLFLHVFFACFVELLGLVTDDFSLFLCVASRRAEGQEQEVSFAAAVVSSSVWLSCMVD